jgi:hypothetical protein
MSRQHKGQETKAGVIGYANKKGGKKKLVKKAASSKGRNRKGADMSISPLSRIPGCEFHCGSCVSCLIAKGDAENRGRIDDDTRLRRW